MSTVEIKMENYGAILRSIQPKLKIYMFKWAQEFRKDISDVEDVVYVSREEAIKKYDKDRGHCTFLNYFITIARNRLINDIRDTYKEKFLLMDLRYNPCELCSKECVKKCFKFKMYYRGLLSLNTAELAQNKDFTREIAEREHAHNMIKTLLKNKPQYKPLLANIMTEIYNGRTGGHALAGGIRRTIEKTKGSRFGLYKQLPEIQRYLLDMDKTGATT